MNKLVWWFDEHKDINKKKWNLTGKVSTLTAHDSNSLRAKWFILPSKTMMIRCRLSLLRMLIKMCVALALLTSSGPAKTTTIWNNKQNPVTELINHSIVCIRVCYIHGLRLAQLIGAFCEYWLGLRTGV